MLVDLQQRLIPALSRLQVPFTIIRGHKDIADFVEVELEDASVCLTEVEKHQRDLQLLSATIHNLNGRRV